MFMQNQLFSMLKCKLTSTSKMGGGMSPTFMLATNSCISRTTTAHVHMEKGPNVGNVVVFEVFHWHMHYHDLSVAARVPC